MIINLYLWDVAVPDNATRSLMSRPLFENTLWRVEKLEDAEGKLPVTSDKRETLPSFLPVSTSHIDLLNCQQNLKGNSMNATVSIIFSIQSHILFYWVEFKKDTYIYKNLKFKHNSFCGGWIEELLGMKRHHEQRVQEYRHMRRFEGKFSRPESWFHQ